MTNLPFLFALAAVLAAMLASIAIWAPRALLVRAGAVACAVLFMPVAYAGLSDLLSRPKPVAMEWWLDQAEEATVLGSQMREGDSLYLWLQLAGEAEPRAYRLPWSQQMAQQLQQALEQAQRNGTEARMRLPFASTSTAPRSPRCSATSPADRRAPRPRPSAPGSDTPAPRPASGSRPPPPAGSP